MGLKDKAGKLAKDDSPLGDLKVKPGMAVMMLGAQEEAIGAAAASSASEGGELVDDLQMQEELFEELEPHKDPVVLVRDRCIECREYFLCGAPCVAGMRSALTAAITLSTCCCGRRL